jgi:hypothetical protein
MLYLSCVGLMRTVHLYRNNTFLFFVNLTCLLSKNGSLKILICVTFGDAVNKMTNFYVKTFLF